LFNSHNKFFDKNFAIKWEPVLSVLLNSLVGH
jgi:hypothetical protein